MPEKCPVMTKGSLYIFLSQNNNDHNGLRSFHPINNYKPALVGWSVVAMVVTVAAAVDMAE